MIVLGLMSFDIVTLKCAPCSIQLKWSHLVSPAPGPAVVLKMAQRIRPGHSHSRLLVARVTHNYGSWDDGDPNRK